MDNVYKILNNNHNINSKSWEDFDFGYKAKFTLKIKLFLLKKKKKKQLMKELTFRKLLLSRMFPLYLPKNVPVINSMNDHGFHCLVTFLSYYDKKVSSLTVMRCLSRGSLGALSDLTTMSSSLGARRLELGNVFVEHLYKISVFAT